MSKITTQSVSERRDPKQVAVEAAKTMGDKLAQRWSDAEEWRRTGDRYDAAALRALSWE